MKKQDSEIPDCWLPSEKTREWLQREYPQLDEMRTVDAFTEWATNAVETNKRHPNYGQPIRCTSWDMKFRNVVRIQMVNKWGTIAIARQGQEIDTGWQEVLAHAKAIGCPLQRRTIDTVEGFRTRIRAWETYDKPRNSVIDISTALKRV